MTRHFKTRRFYILLGGLLGILSVMLASACDPSSAPTSSPLSDETGGIGASPTSTPTPLASPKDGKFFVSSTKDRIKTINIRHDPRVNLCILHESFPFRYVQVQGQARVTDEDLEATSRRIYGTFRETLADDFPDQLAQEGRIIIEITPENVTPSMAQRT